MTEQPPEQPPTTLRELQNSVDAWIQSIGVRYFSPLSNLAQLTEEVGELARAMNRTYGDQSPKPDEPSTGEPSTGGIADELADVLFVVTCLANQCGVDLQAAVAANLQKKTRRDATRHRRNSKLVGERAAAAEAASDAAERHNQSMDKSEDQRR